VPNAPRSALNRLSPTSDSERGSDETFAPLAFPHTFPSARQAAPPSCNNLRMDADKQICGMDPDGQYVELAVEVFALLADATRVRIILALRREEELSVNHLAELVGKSPAAVSQHLAKLRMARIVATRQEGQRVFYRLENEHASQLVSDAIFQAEHSLGGLPRHHHTERGGA